MVLLAVVRLVTRLTVFRFRRSWSPSPEGKSPSAVSHTQHWTNWNRKSLVNFGYSGDPTPRKAWRAGEAVLSVSRQPEFGALRMARRALTNL